MTNQEIIEMFHSDLTLQEVRKLSGVRHSTVSKLWIDTFGKSAFEERKRIKYRNSKLGDKNPMKGKVKSKHPNWTHYVSDSNGYSRVKAPSWYTGKIEGSGYIREHVVNYCSSRGLTELPEGFDIHHLDLDKKNNNPKNLIMLPHADHMLLHGWITKLVVQRLSHKGSTVDWKSPEAHNTHLG